MKIIKIEIQNINSLRCEEPVCIDFEREPFVNIGLFAITGNTGAGKTTILDAITIALYHDVPRFNKSHIKAGLDDVVSHGAESAISRVTFDCNGVRYESSWFIRVADKHGKRLSSSREEYRLKNLTTGCIMAQKKKDVEREVETITSLTYNQFLRSVMLAQGEFAAFLSAPSREKGALLEQIAGQEIYKRIGEVVGDRIYTEKSKLVQLQGTINYQDVLTDEIRASLEQRQSSLSISLQQMYDEQRKLARVTGWYASQSTLDADAVRLAQDQAELALDTQAREAVLQCLARHEMAEPFKELVDNLARVEKDIDQKTSLVLAEDKHGVLLQAEVDMLASECAKKRELLAASESALLDWTPRLDTVMQLDVAISNLVKDIGTRRETLDALDKQRSEMSNQVPQMTTRRDTMVASLASIDEFLTSHRMVPEIESHLPTWVTALAQRHNLFTTGISLTEKIEQINRELRHIEGEQKTMAGEKKRRQDVCDTSKHEIDQLAAFLAQNPLDALLAEKQSIEKISADLQILKQLLASQSQLLARKDDLVQAQTHLQVLIDELDRLHTVKKNEQIACELSLVDAEQLLLMEIKIKEFENERSLLEEGKPCVLCGSLHHPYVAQYKPVAVTERQKDVDTRKKALKAMSEELTSLEIKHGQTITSLQNNQSQLSEVLVMLEKTRHEIQAATHVLGDEDVSRLDEQVNAVNQRLSNISGIIISIRDKQKLKDLKQEEWDEQQAQVSQVTTLLAKLEEKQHGLNNNLLSDEKERVATSQRLAEQEKCLAEELASFLLELPTVDHTDQFVKSLQALIATFNLKKETRNTLFRERLVLEKEIENAQAMLSSIIKDHQVVTALVEEAKKNGADLKMQRSALLPINVQVAQKRESLHAEIDSARKENIKTEQAFVLATQAKTRSESACQTYRVDLLKYQAMLTDLNASLAHAIGQSSFVSRDDIEQSLLSSHTRKEYGTIKKDLDDRRLSCETLGGKLLEERRKLDAEKDFDMTLQEAKAQATTCEETIKNILQERGEIKNKFAHDEQIRQRNALIIDQLQLQEKELKRWETLLKLLGGTRDSFNTYVQRLTLKNLIARANTHLLRLNNRYSLFMGSTYKPDEELVFELVDHFQTSERRKVETASGGEKFVISLSLALGLSDLASKNVSIGSLFIDEGFGTLDSETLEVVISTLETLQSQGKLIGVISHVESLKDRIPTQIRIDKRTNGISKVVIS